MQRQAMTEKGRIICQNRWTGKERRMILQQSLHAPSLPCAQYSSHQPCVVLCISLKSIFSYLNLKAHNWTFYIPFSSKTFKRKYFFNFMWLSDDFFWVGLFFNWKKTRKIKYVKVIKTVIIFNEMGRNYIIYLTLFAL